MPGGISQPIPQGVLPLLSHIPFLEKWYAAHPHPALFWKNKADEGRTSQPELAHIRDQLRLEFPGYHVSIVTIKDAIRSKSEWKGWLEELEAMMDQAVTGSKSALHFSLTSSSPGKKRKVGGLPKPKWSNIPTSTPSIANSSISHAVAIPTTGYQTNTSYPRRTQSMSSAPGINGAGGHWKMPPTRPRAMTYNGNSSSSNFPRARDRSHPYGSPTKRVAHPPFAGSSRFQRGGLLSNYHHGHFQLPNAQLARGGTPYQGYSYSRNEMAFSAEGAKSN